MVTMLNEVFSHFDQLAEKHGLEKIKTIGDAYMVAGGLDEHHRDEACRERRERDYSARDLRAWRSTCANYMDTLSGIKRARLQIHIGIGTGPVVAGVIGMKKFIYDLWGDTVNIASRVTAEAGPGTILVDATTYRRVRDQFEFEGPQIAQRQGQGRDHRLSPARAQAQAADAAGVGTEYAVMSDE